MWEGRPQALEFVEALRHKGEMRGVKSEQPQAKQADLTPPI